MNDEQSSTPKWLVTLIQGIGGLAGVVAIAMVLWASFSGAGVTGIEEAQIMAYRLLFLWSALAVSTLLIHVQ